MKKGFDYLIGDYKANIGLSQPAIDDCAHFGFAEILVKETPTFAEDYVSAKETGQRFTIVDTDLKMVVTGVVEFKEGNDLSLLITSVSGDIEMVASGRDVAVF